MAVARQLALAVLGGLLATCSAQPRAPVLIELFTSEGCSSCPPADRLLEKLDPRAIILSEHVDYWDRLGWKDPYSSAKSTARQQGYSRILNLEGPYTPQMVIDGTAEFVGSDGAKASAAIDQAGHHKKADVRLSRTEAGLEIAVDGAPGAAEVYLALADESATSQVSGGENGGRTLHHVAVLRSLQKVGSVKRGAGFNKVTELPREAAAQRVIVFLQESGPGKVLGVAMLPPVPGAGNIPRVPPSSVPAPK